MGAGGADRGRKNEVVSSSSRCYYDVQHLVAPVYRAAVVGLQYSVLATK
jgi:hypothetical protein